jgi:hypothetical protein
MLKRNLCTVSMIAFVTAAYGVTGCAEQKRDGDILNEEAIVVTQESQASELSDSPPVEILSATHSFTRSCKGWAYTYVPALDVITAASADGCLQSNGLYGKFTTLSGRCPAGPTSAARDVSNCNGKIVCQTHCP